MGVALRDNTLSALLRFGDTTAILRLFLGATMRLGCRGDRPNMSAVDLASAFGSGGLGFSMRPGSFRLCTGDPGREEGALSLKEMVWHLRADLWSWRGGRVCSTVGVVRERLWARGEPFSLRL